MKNLISGDQIVYKHKSQKIKQTIKTSTLNTNIDFVVTESGREIKTKNIIEVYRDGKKSIWSGSIKKCFFYITECRNNPAFSWIKFPIKLFNN